MYKLIPAVALAAATTLSAAAWAQTTTTPTAPHAVTTPHTTTTQTTPVTPVAPPAAGVATTVPVPATTRVDVPAAAQGANSFTQAQAQKRIEDQGFSNVSGLAKDAQGVWRGTAMKQGASHNVGVDYKGNVVSK